MTRVPSTRNVGLASVAAMSLLLAACNTGTPEEHLARGKEMAAKQDHAGAVVELKNALQSRPKLAEARFLLGRELLAQGDARAAEIELQRAFDARYDRDAVVPALVRSQILQGSPEKIAPAVAKAELNAPHANAELQALLGAAGILQGKTDDALQAYRKAQQYEPDYAPAVLGEARLRATRGDLPGAGAQLASVLEKDPTNVDGLVLKGDLARAAGDVALAVASYQAAIKINPRHLPARLDLADVLVQKDTLDQAEAQLNELKKLAPRDPAVAYLDALIAYDKKDFLHANDAIARSLTADPKNAVSQLLSGAILLAMNQPAQAEIHFIEGLKLRPDSTFGRRLLVGLYLKQNEPQKASDVLRPALLASPDDTTLLGLAAQTAVELGDFAGAATYFERSGAVDPSNVEAKVGKGIANLARGQESTGFAALEAAAKDNGNEPSADAALVVTRLNRGQYDQALAAWQQLEKHVPNSPTTYNLRAAIDLGRKDPASARKALEHAVQLQPTFFPAVANLARLDEREGHVNEARQRYRALLNKDKNVLAMIALAQLEAKQGAKSDVVLPLLVEARKTNPKAEQPVTALVAYYLSQGNDREALATAQEASNGSPSNPGLALLVADLQLKSGNVDQAAMMYRQLTAAKPSSVLYQLRLGQALAQSNQADQAMAAFVKAFRAQPESYAVQTEAVDLLLNTKHAPEATRLFEEIQRVAPRNPALTEMQGDLRMAAGQYADAVALFRKAMRQAPSTPVVLKLSGALRRAGNTADAGSVVDDWLKTHPEDAAVRAFSADMAMDSKDFTRAAAGYRALLAGRPNDPTLLNNLAWSLYQLKDPEALRYAQQANELAPNRVEVSDTLGWILVEQGEVQRGVQLLQAASTAAPAHVGIRLHLAKAQIKLGKKDDARATLQSLIKSAPQSAEARESKRLIASL